MVNQEWDLNGDSGVRHKMVVHKQEEMVIQEQHKNCDSGARKKMVIQEQEQTGDSEVRMKWWFKSENKIITLYYTKNDNHYNIKIGCRLHTSIIIENWEQMPWLLNKFTQWKRKLGTSMQDNINTTETIWIFSERYLQAPQQRYLYTIYTLSMCL